jgi:hypothetical protein
MATVEEINDQKKFYFNPFEGISYRNSRATAYNFELYLQTFSI